MKRIFAALAVAVALAGCRTTVKDRVTKDLLSLPKEELFARGKALLAKKKPVEARKYLNFVFESYPNDPLGQQALLLVADSYFSRDRSVGYIEARYRYRDYLTRYPSASNRDFALYRYALCYDKDSERPDRDPTNTREALVQYRALLKEVPNSEYAEKARRRIQALNDLLAEHEFGVGFFYFRKGDPAAALGRFQYLEEHYPDYSFKAKLFYYIGMSFHRLGKKTDAERYFARLQAEFPKSDWTHRVRPSGDVSG
jgi:outer membrane protein assembly factor BamD